MALFSGWLHATKVLQEEKYGNISNLRGDAYGDNVRQNVVGAIEELGEYLKEADWKPWKPRPQFASDDFRARRREELVDVLHFVANLCVIEGLDDRVLSDIYLEKLAFNRARSDHHDAVGDEGDQI